ncbi:DUF4129 domain-containing protein [Neosynechococcus sphagnicola]|uniref:DUF4129 domain-containing protein n=1 Tax=Neosynechococcus sphagnicola TaxID=1501145 RepID=UPI001955278F|nr:DUF4129 domain-containing protein [Neosynechococcus sphagnicola]
MARAETPGNLDAPTGSRAATANPESPPPPTLPPRRPASWLQAAQAFYRQGNYREACRALYLATLQQLHETHLIPHQASRTDGEYLQLVEALYMTAVLPHIQPLQTLIQTHERSHFSPDPISRQEYDGCWQAYQQLQLPTSPRQEAG